MHGLRLILSLAAIGACVSAEQHDTVSGGVRHSGRDAKARHCAESFLTAVVRRDWATASTLLSNDSPMAPAIDRKAVTILGCLRRSEVLNVAVDGDPIALVTGCGKFRGPTRGRYEFIMTLLEHEQVWGVYSFEIAHRSVDGPAIPCS
jgi:hypothetical protein